jgi:hypothetical protein
MLAGFQRVGELFLESSGVRDDKIHIMGGTVFSTGTITDLLSQEYSGTVCGTFLLVLKHGVFYNKFTQTMLHHSKPV